jgi:GntR family transcriptional regulator
MKIPDRPATVLKRGRPSKYLAIRDWIAARIASGAYQSGSQLPSEHEIMAQFEVSRVTARQALDDLRRLGLVFSLQGKGYFVRHLKAVLDLLRLQSFGEMMAPLGLPTSSKVLSIEGMPAAKDVAEALQLSPGDPVIQIKRMRLAGGSVVSIDVSYFRVEIGRKLRELDLESHDVFTLLEKQLDTELGFADLAIETVPADASLAPLLTASQGDVILRISRLTHDDRGHPVDFEYLFARLDTFQFRVRSARW